jgi:hypothetical protein
LEKTAKIFQPLEKNFPIIGKLFPGPVGAVREIWEVRLSAAPHVQVHGAAESRTSGKAASPFLGPR